MKRAAAVLGALAMVVGALAVRARIDDGGGGGGGSSSSGSGRAVVACVTELADACRTAYGDDASVELRIEDASTTTAALGGAKPGIDVWVTLSGWPELVGQKPAHPSLVATALASSPIVLAAVSDRATALGTGCTTGPWHCLLAAAGRPWTDAGGRPEWGTVKLAIPPAGTALGLLVRAEALASVATNGVDVATNDDDYATILGSLGRAQDEADPLGPFLLAFPASYAAVATTGAALDARVGRYRDRVTTLTPEVPATAVAVLARVAGGRGVSADRLRQALTGAGWTTPPADPHLPDPGVLLALSGA